MRVDRYHSVRMLYVDCPAIASFLHLEAVNHAVVDSQHGESCFTVGTQVQTGVEVIFTKFSESSRNTKILLERPCIVGDGVAERNHLKQGRHKQANDEMRKRRFAASPKSPNTHLQFFAIISSKQDLYHIFVANRRSFYAAAALRTRKTSQATGARRRHSLAIAVKLCKLIRASRL